MAHHLSFWDGKQDALTAAFHEGAPLQALWRRLVRDGVVAAPDAALSELLAAPPFADPALRWAPLGRDRLCSLLLRVQRRNARLLARWVCWHRERRERKKKEMNERCISECALKENTQGWKQSMRWRSHKQTEA